MGDKPAGSMVKDKKGDKDDKKRERKVQLNLKSTPIGIRNTIVSEKPPTKKQRTSSSDQFLLSESFSDELKQIQEGIIEIKESMVKNLTFKI